MKKISIATLLGLMLILNGCGSSSDNDESDTNISVIQNPNSDQNPNDDQLNHPNNPSNAGETTSSSDTPTPPTWIQGTWMDRSEPLLPTGWLFTADDVYTIVGENSISLTAEGLQQGDTIEQSSSDVRYEFTIQHQNSTETYIFNKLSDTQINYENPFTGGTTGPFIKE